MLRRLGYVLVVVGALGFFAPFYLPRAGTSLRNIELPTFFETITIVLPDGGRLTATQPTQRVQRYDRDGRFQYGWFINTGGGLFAIGLSRDGDLVVCTVRGKRTLVYDFEGKLVHEESCLFQPHLNMSPLEPWSFPSSAIQLQQVDPAQPPLASWQSFALVPLWHPFVAWLMIAGGGVMLRITRADAVARA